MVGSRWSATSPGRRRGPELERAILDAALEQLSTVGWNALTMEGVAAGAHTGKAAVYRRWPSKADLVADVLRTGLPPIGAIADHGSIRGDLIRLCVRMRDVMESRAARRCGLSFTNATTPMRVGSTTSSGRGCTSPPTG